MHANILIVDGHHATATATLPHHPHTTKGLRLLLWDDFLIYNMTRIPVAPLATPNAGSNSSKNDEWHLPQPYRRSALAV